MFRVIDYHSCLIPNVFNSNAVLFRVIQKIEIMSKALAGVNREHNISDNKKNEYTLLKGIARFCHINFKII